MLTDLERTYLENSDSLDEKQKKNLNHRIKNKLILIEDTLNDIRLILEKYPEDLVKDHISNTTVNLAAAALERVLHILDPWPIGEYEDGEMRAFRVWGSIIPSSQPGKCTIDSASRTALENEINLSNRLKEHLDKVRFYVDPCTPDPICHNPVYTELQREELLKIAKKYSKPLSASFDAYLDETGVSESGWVLREPTIVEVSKLQKMRWKPRGLKSCMRLPPLVKEKKILSEKGLIRLTARGNKEGTSYFISINEGEDRLITRNEFMEASKKLGIIGEEENNS
jgi:hypothetical protein